MASKVYTIALSLALRLSNNNIIAVWIETIALNTAATTPEVQKIHLATMSLFFWFWEKKWVEFSEVAYSSNSDSEPLHIMINEYIDAGLISFEQMDDTPITLKALLFNQFCHHANLSLIDGAEAFKTFYVHEYAKSTINLYK